MKTYILQRPQSTDDDEFPDPLSFTRENRRHYAWRSFPRVRTWRIGTVLLMLGAALILGNAGPAKADIISVGYTATNIGGTTWMYGYALSGTYSAGDDVAIYFPYATSSTLTDLATGGASFTTFALQPDLALPANGEFDILANASGSSAIPTTFNVTFSYSGNGSPGAQDFSLLDSNFNTIQTGITMAAAATPTPEPGFFVLLGAGLVAMGTTRRLKR